MLSIAIRQGRAQQAEQRLAALVQQAPQNAALHFLYGLASFELKDLPQAEASARSALKLDARLSDAYTLLSNIALKRGNTAEAKGHLRSAIAADPRRLLNYTTLLTLYEQEGNWEEAKRIAERAHEVDPSSPLICAELAFLYLEHGGDVNTAVSLAQSAKQQLPDSPVTSHALGWAYYKAGSVSSAVIQLKESSDKVPANPIYQYHLAMAYIANRRFDLAGQSLRTALRTDPHFPYAAKARAALDELPKGNR
jgi:tetratricopeptide (TPR) repeat protein